LLGLPLAGCGVGDPEAPPKRVHLFDLMAEAELQGPAETDAVTATVTTTVDFDAHVPEDIRFARVDGRRLRYEEEEGQGVSVDPEGGVTGAGLKLGPAEPQDESRALFRTPVTGPSRVRITGRVRLEDNPHASDTTTREVLRVIESSSSMERRWRASRWARAYSSTHRASRRIDPSGWDSFELELLTEAKTRSLEIQLLHRSGDSDLAVTRFDDLVVEEIPLTNAEIVEQLSQRYRPRDGREDATPWRLRVPLRAAEGRLSETRDAVLLNAPATLSLPVRIPAAETAPRLRFQYGMLPEAFRIDGDGAVIEVGFRKADGEVLWIGREELDPKGERDQRKWFETRFDLTKVAGLEGRLEFTTRDVPDSEPDELDAVLLSSPRIEPANEPPTAFNVLLIGVDTLRADHLSAFGYERPTTPHLEELAAESILFPQTRAQAPWTLPSFASILTSTYPSRHGAGRGGHDEWTPIDPTTTSLAEVLARVGYETFGLVANHLISSRYGLDQGFEAFRSSWSMESAEGDASSVAAFVDAHRTTPWLAFWHIMDPHLPYVTEADFRERFTDAEYDGRFAGGRTPYVPFEVLDPRPGRRWFAHEGPPPAPDLSEADRRFVSDYYDAEIAEMDEAVGRVLDAIRESGQWERTIVAFVADHGEGLGDHDHYHHGYTLFDDQVHIPMILRIPGRDEGRVVGRPVASIDLVPTILGGIGLDVPAFYQGVDRLAAGAPSDDAVFVEYPTYDSSAQKAWILGDFKYLHDPWFRTEALYHLGEDPAEKRNVVAEYPDVVSRARAELDAFRWEQLQKGRMHLRVRAAVGGRLQVRIETDDLFDANFASRPLLPEERFTMEVDRRALELDTVLEEEAVELVFWCRGRMLDVSVVVDGEPLPGGLLVGVEAASRELPARLEIDRDLPRHPSEDIPWPAKGRACLWVETGVADVMPVVPSPEELELLRDLGYAR